MLIILWYNKTTEREVATMEAEIVEIIEWYNGKGELIQHTIVYESGRHRGFFEKLPKKAEKWLERAKREATYINETKTGNCTRKTYRKVD